MSMPGLTQAESDRANAAHQIARIAGLLDRPAMEEAAIMGYRQAGQAELDARCSLSAKVAVHDDAIGFAELTVGKQVAREGSKIFVPDDDDGPEGGRRQVSADEAKTWAAQKVRQVPEVAEAATARAVAARDLDEARIAAAVAERKVSAAKGSLRASIAYAELLGALLGK